MRTFHVFNKMFFCFLFSFLMFPPTTRAQSQVLGEVQFVGKTKADKTSGVWVDGQYLGYVAELKEDKKVLLLPGEHEIAVRQSGYTDFTQKVVVEPHKKVVVEVVMLKDPRSRLPKVTSQIKLHVKPERAAVFVDDAFVGTVSELESIASRSHWPATRPSKRTSASCRARKLRSRPRCFRGVSPRRGLRLSKNSFPDLFGAWQNT